jgi:hypothetical protein
VSVRAYVACGSTTTGAAACSYLTNCYRSWPWREREQVFSEATPIRSSLAMKGSRRRGRVYPSSEAHVSALDAASP